jgi:hypothetical protein
MSSSCLTIPAKWDATFFYRVLNAFSIPADAQPHPPDFTQHSSQCCQAKFIPFLHQQKTTFPYNTISSTRRSFRCHWHVTQLFSRASNCHPHSILPQFDFLLTADAATQQKDNLICLTVTKRIFPLPAYLDDMIFLLQNAGHFGHAFRSNICLAKLTTVWRTQMATFVYGFACLSTPNSPQLTPKGAIKCMIYSLLSLILEDLDLQDCLPSYDFSSRVDSHCKNNSTNTIQSLATLITKSVYDALFWCMSSVATSSTCRSGTLFPSFLRQQQHSYPYSQIPPQAILDMPRTLSSMTFLIKNAHNDTFMLVETPSDLLPTSHPSLIRLMKAKQAFPVPCPAVPILRVAFCSPPDWLSRAAAPHLPISIAQQTFRRWKQSIFHLFFRLFSSGLPTSRHPSYADLALHSLMLLHDTLPPNCSILSSSLADDFQHQFCRIFDSHPSCDAEGYTQLMIAFCSRLTCHPSSPAIGLPIQLHTQNIRTRDP